VWVGGVSKRHVGRAGRGRAVLVFRPTPTDPQSIPVRAGARTCATSSNLETGISPPDPAELDDLERLRGFPEL
jgi:hypothetical protein